MNIVEYLNSISLDERRAFALRVPTSVEHLAQLKGGHSSPGPKLCRKLVAAADGKLTLEELRPDLWESDAA